MDRATKGRVITVYTLEDADRVLKNRRRRRRIQIVKLIVDLLDRAACALIFPGSIAAIVYLFLI